MRRINISFLLVLALVLTINNANASVIDAVNNVSFESSFNSTGVDNWRNDYFDKGTRHLTPSYARSGSYVALLKPFGYVAQYVDYRLTSSTEYNVVAYVMPSGVSPNVQVRIVVSYISSSGTSHTSSYTKSVQGQLYAWYKVTFDHDLLPGYSKITQIKFYNPSSSLATPFYVDDVSVVPVSVSGGGPF